MPVGECQPALRSFGIGCGATAFGICPAAEIKRKTLELGFYACNFPEEVGGAGLSHLEFALVERELGRGSMALTHFFGRPQNILMACEGEKVEKYLMPAVRGEKMDALAMTEPDAGSDVRGMKCQAVRDGGDWVVNGSKHFISGAEHADFVIVFVATGVDETPRGPKKRITCFLVDRGTPGFEPTRINVVAIFKIVKKERQT